jgi:hypothetical protein
VPIYHSFGIDDVGAMCDFLVAEEHWAQRNGIVYAKDLGLEMKHDKLIRKIEEKGMEQDLRMVVGDVWQSIEEACEIKRKSRYE